MALLTWRVRDSKGQEIGPTFFLDFDATLVEEFTRSAEVTTFPVENGAVLSDHHQPQPRAISLEVTVSDTPVRTNAPREGAQSAVEQAIGTVRPKALELKPNPAPVTGISGARIIQGNVARFPKKRTASVLQFIGGVTRTTDVFQELDNLMQYSVLVNVVLFGSLEYKNMLITNVRAPRNASSGSTLTFTIDLLQVEFADTEERKTQASPEQDQHKGRRDVGNRNPKPVESTDPARTRFVGSSVYSSVDTSRLPSSLLR